MLRLLFIGEGLALAGAIEIARSRGHEVAGVFCTSASEAASMARAGLPVSGPAGKASAFVAANPCDVLFSIHNHRILDAATLARPRLAAVNYHNAPLPAYGGLWAAAWCIVNGEAEHGITWHLMEPGIDTGPILLQHRFALVPDETAGSLNLRCSEAALESFGVVLDGLERGDIPATPQDTSHRSYYGRKDSAPNGGIIDWRWPLANILRLVRACDWGVSSNTFGEARIVLPDGSSHVVRAAAAAAGSGRPGTILAADGQSLTVACGDGAVRLQLALAPDLKSITSLPVGVDIDEPSGNDPVTATAVTDLLSLVLEKAAADPTHPAIIAGDAVVSRGDLLAQAQRIAATLLARRLQREAGVGLLLPMGADFIAAALGTMLAGGAFVPLNPSSPPARLAFEIAEAGITHVIGEPVEGISPSAWPDIVFITAGADSAAASSSLPAIAPAQSAYRIFTSGSTGRPKAVEIPHAALANLVAYYHSVLPMGPGYRTTALAHPTFDASITDVWPSLAAGGCVLISPRDILLDPAGLIAWLHDARASCSFVPTAIAERLFRLPWPERMELRTLLTGGSALHHRPPPGLPFKVVNTYGPTENTVDSLWGEVSPQGGRPNIGKPIRGVTARVIGEDGRPVRPGEPGELVLGGAQVAIGYRGRRELTAERFPHIDGARCYRTGDLVRMDLHGDYEFHGRIDDQVQVMGVRVEPGEIEALLKADPRVADAICLPLRAGDEVTGLIAHVAPRPGHDAAGDLAAQLRLMLQEQLPVAIVPRALRLHAALPYTNAGKIDRQALAEADVAAMPPVAQSAEETDLLRAIWLACLPATAADAGEDQSFWTLGGDSLAALELLMRLDKEAGLRVPIGVFLADPTLRGIRKAGKRGAIDPSVLFADEPQQPGSFITLQSKGTAPPLYVIHGWGGRLLKFRHFAQAMAPRRAVYGMESSPPDSTAPQPDSLAELAASYAEQIMAHALDGPIHLLGHSIGGWYAHAVAGALLERGATVGLLGILDTDVVGPVLDRKVQLRLLPGKATAQLARVPRKALRLLRPKNQAAPAMPDPAMPGPDPLVHLLWGYRPARLPVIVDLFSPRRQIARLAPVWRHYATQGVELHPMFDGHLDFLEASQASTLVAAVETALRRIEA